MERTPTPEPSDEPPQDDPENPPTPTPPPQDEPTPSPTPDDRHDPNDDRPPFPWWIILVILAVSALIVWRYLATEPVRRARRRPQQGAEILFDASLRLLALGGLARRPEETMHDFAARAEKPLQEKHMPSLLPMTDQIAAQVYGRHAADAKPFETYYLAIRKASPPLKRFAAVMKNMLCGNRKKPKRKARAAKPKKTRKQKKR